MAGLVYCTTYHSPSEDCEAVVSSRGLLSLLEALIRYRWSRLAIAVFPLVIGTIIALSAFSEADVKAAHGVQISGVETWTDSETGAYAYSRVKLVGSTTGYTYDRTDFTPVLTDETLLNTTTVDIWYEDSPFTGGARLLAIQLYSADGIPTTKYVTQWYLQPERVRNNDLRPAAVLLAGALALVLWGVLVPLPMRRKPMPKSIEGVYGAPQETGRIGSS